MRSIFVLGLALCLVAAPALAEEKPETKEQLVMELIEMTGGGDMASQIMQAMTSQMRPAFPAVPEEFWTELANSFDVSELTALVVPIYVKHYSREDIEAAVAFYRSPAGKNLVGKMPLVMQESSGAGIAWGQRKAAEIVEKLRKRGFEPVQM